MTDSLEARVAALEAKVGDKSLDERFREQAELLDRLFIYRFDELDRRWEAQLDRRFERFEQKLDQKFEQKLEQKLEEKLEAKLSPIRVDLTAVRDAVEIILQRLP